MSIGITHNCRHFLWYTSYWYTPLFFRPQYPFIQIQRKLINDIFIFICMKQERREKENIKWVRGFQIFCNNLLTIQDFMMALKVLFYMRYHWMRFVPRRMKEVMYIWCSRLRVDPPHYDSFSDYCLMQSRHNQVTSPPLPGWSIRIRSEDFVSII